MPVGSAPYLEWQLRAGALGSRSVPGRYLPWTAPVSLRNGSAASPGPVLQHDYLAVDRDQAAGCQYLQGPGHRRSCCANHCREICLRQTHVQHRRARCASIVMDQSKQQLRQSSAQVKEYEICCLFVEAADQCCERTKDRLEQRWL